MTALIDIDQLRTFIAIAETGSFTKAAEIVHKTQSAVSMQMKRLEERLDRPIFARDGRASKLTEDGERLLAYAQRIVKLNAEAVNSIANAALSGRVRLGVPDDYADRYLPEIMARFSRSHPEVELTVLCEPTDLTSVAVALATQSEGSVLIHEWMFESRLIFTDKLATMGADIVLCDPHRAIVTGPRRRNMPWTERQLPSS